MKKLNLFEHQEKKCVVRFEEFLTNDGHWKKSQQGSDSWDVVVEIPRSNYGEYRYFLCQDRGDEFISQQRIKK